MIGTCGPVVALMAPPAGATVNRNSIGCSGQAVITKTNGQTLTINASQSEAHVPRKAGRVQYSGSVTTVTHNQHGYVAVVVGPWKVNFYTWGGKNNSNKTTDTGSRAYPSVLKDVPPGKYKVSGGHFATEGSCTGSMTIVIDGGPLSNPVGLGALIGTIVFALILLTSLFGHPIVGGFGGLLLAPFVIADLMLFKVSPPTSLILFGAPIVAILIGIGLGLWGPLSRGASPPN
jgi:hypothetical protein